MPARRSRIDPRNSDAADDWMQRAVALHKQIAACEAKIAFKTKGRALIYSDRRGFPNRPYLCPVCGEWHLSSKALR